MYYLVNQYFEL